MRSSWYSTTATRRASSAGIISTNWAHGRRRTGRHTWSGLRPPVINANLKVRIRQISAPRSGARPVTCNSADRSRIQRARASQQAMKTTHFGFERIPASDKQRKVGGVFRSVAPRYDVMNDLMSFGIHRLWKFYALLLTNVRRGQRVLDVAAGTGDLALRLADRVGPGGEMVLCDINDAMLTQARDRMIDRGLAANVCYVLADAERLPFADDCFDRITIAFGLRNVTDQDAALAAMHRVLKPGGSLLVLELSLIHISEPTRRTPIS